MVFEGGCGGAGGLRGWIVVNEGLLVRCMFLDFIFYIFLTSLVELVRFNQGKTVSEL